MRADVTGAAGTRSNSYREPRELGVSASAGSASRGRPSTLRAKPTWLVRESPAANGDAVCGAPGRTVAWLSRLACWLVIWNSSFGQTGCSHSPAVRPSQPTRICHRPESEASTVRMRAYPRPLSDAGAARYHGSGRPSRGYQCR